MVLAVPLHPGEVPGSQVDDRHPGGIRTRTGQVAGLVVGGHHQQRLAPVGVGLDPVHHRLDGRREVEFLLDHATGVVVVARPVDGTPLDHQEHPVGVVVEDVEGGLGHLLQGGHRLHEGHHEGIGMGVAGPALLQGVADLRHPDHPVGRRSGGQRLEFGPRVDQQPRIVVAVPVGVTAGHTGDQVPPGGLAAAVLPGTCRSGDGRVAVAVVEGMAGAHDHVEGAVVHHLLADLGVVVPRHVVG